MGSKPQPDERKGLAGATSDPAGATSDPAGGELERRFPVALGLYVVLGLLVWFTMGEERVLVRGRPVDLRLVPLIVIGGLALRTVLARSAERIRRQSGSGRSSL